LPLGLGVGLAIGAGGGAVWTNSGRHDRDDKSG
jgi:hypothetical protein